MKFAKAIVAAVGALATVLVPILADNVVDAGEAGQVASALVAAVATVYAVYRTPNAE